MRRAIRSLLLGLAWASIWPAYLVLVAQVARLGPWPRNLAILASTALHGLAIGAFVPGVLAWMTRRDGWTERFLGVPEAVGRQLCRTSRFLAAAAVIFLVPVYLLSSGGFAPGGRPIRAAAFCRFLILGFELAVWAALVPLVRRGSAILHWCNLQASEASSGNPESDANSSASVDAFISDPGSKAAEHGASGWLAWISRRRRVVAWTVLRLPAGLLHSTCADTVSQPGGWPSVEPRPCALPGLLGLQSRCESDHHPPRQKVGTPGTLLGARSEHCGHDVRIVTDP